VTESASDLDPQVGVNDRLDTMKPTYSVEIKYAFIYDMTYLNHSECYSVYSPRFLYPYIMVRKQIKLFDNLATFILPLNRTVQEIPCNL
jgi:preprotein translocase subunit SecB